MKSAKKILVLLLCAVLLVGASVAGTVAYLTSQDEVVNNFTVGQVRISLDEALVDDNGDTVTGDNADRVQTNDYKLLPGHAYDKDPTVHVTQGSEDCYVRMFVTITHNSQWDTICGNHVDEQGNNLFGAEDMFTGLNTTAWLYKSSTPGLAGENTRTYEFWYNTKVIDVPKDADKNLEALFTGIEMPGELTNEDLALLADDPDTEADESFKIYVVAQAIQADGFADADAAFGENGAPAITGDALIPGVVTDTP